MKYKSPQPPTVIVLALFGFVLILFQSLTCSGRPFFNPGYRPPLCHIFYLKHATLSKLAQGREAARQLLPLAAP